MDLDDMKAYGGTVLRLLAVLGGVGGVALLGWLGWQWQKTVTVGHVAVSGVQNAPPDTVRQLARVDSGTVMDTIDGALVTDRVERHPWVKTAAVTKQRAQRTLLLSVTERTPIALAIDDAGRPAYYLDATGHAMPCPDSAGYDVPLVRGLGDAYHPVRRVAPAPLDTMLAVLAESDTAPLIAELDVQPDSTVRLITAPIGTHGALPVRIGRGNIAAKLRRLRAFAEQILTTTPSKNIQAIDLRFDGQIVTHEPPLDG